MIQVGDRVEIIDPIFNSYGVIGLVTAVYSVFDSPYPLTVDIENFGPTAFRYEEVRKVS